MRIGELLIAGADQLGRDRLRQAAHGDRIHVIGQRRHRPPAPRIDIHGVADLDAPATRRVHHSVVERGRQRHGSLRHIDDEQPSAPQGDKGVLARALGDRTDGRGVGVISAFPVGQIDDVLGRVNRELMVRIVGPDADELLLRDVGRDQHLVIGRRPGGMHVFAHRQAGVWLQGVAVHDEDLSAQERHDNVRLILGEKQHVGAAHGLLGGILAKLVQVPAEVHGFLGFGRGRTGGQLRAIVNVQISPALLGRIRLVRNPDFVGLRARQAGQGQDQGVDACQEPAHPGVMSCTCAIPLHGNLLHVANGLVSGIRYSRGCGAYSPFRGTVNGRDDQEDREDDQLPR